MPILGGHVSASQSILKALERAALLEFQCLQFHPSSPQTWARPKISEEDIALFPVQAKEKGLEHIYFHSIYLVNLASPLDSIWHGSIEITKNYLHLADRLNVRGVITHLGSHKGSGLESSLPRMEAALKQISNDTPGNRFIIENTAGSGGTIGSTLEELEIVFNRLKPVYSNLGVCIDTCHAFAAGIPIHTKEGLDGFLDEFDRRIGLDNLQCFHLNDSRFPFASNKDRHENLGDGYLGYTGLGGILRHPLLQNLPYIMEVPGLEGNGPDQINLHRAKDLAAGKL